MNKIFKIIIVLCLITSWVYANTQHHHHPKDSKKVQHKHKTIYKLNSHIDGISLSDGLNYHIIVRPGPNELVVDSSPTDKFVVHKKNLNGILYLYLTENHTKVSHKIFHYKPISNYQIYLYLNQLRYFKQHRFGNVHIAYHRSGQSLDVQKTGRGNLYIKGKRIHLKCFSDQGSGRVTITGIQTKSLVVADSGRGQVKLIGPAIGLHRLTGENLGKLTIKKIKSDYLAIDFSNDGKVKLMGLANVANIDYSGSGSMDMYWLQSKNLNIDMTGHGDLELAGVVNKINANVYCRAHLDLRYLRANTVFVKTYGHANVDLWVNKNLYARADNHSNIYYYSRPVYKTRILHNSASILSMAAIPSAIVNFNQKQTL